MAGRDLTNTLYYGDNLEILKRFISDGTVDLVYLDPPFNKNVADSVIFHDETGRSSDAQIRTFEDSWHWGPTPARHYEYLTNSAQHAARVPQALADLIGAFHTAIRPSPMLAYLVEMATRLVELHRVLKPTGSLYLHCDPTASHYLKLLLDAVFGPERFLNEITWKRTHSHGNVGRNLGSITDTILVYTKSDAYTWNQPWAPLGEAYVAGYYRQADPDGRRWRSVTLRNPAPRPNLQYPYQALNGETYQPHPNGWVWTQERMRRSDEQGRLVYPRKPTGALMMKQYLDESRGVRLQNLWDDIRPVGAQAKERVGFPTQKPITLLERIIGESTNPGDVVLDPFCGCGTAIEASVKLERRWIGIDVSRLAKDVILDRMKKRGIAVEVFWWPTEVDGAREMAESKPDGRHQFEAWALTRLGAQPIRVLGGKGADQGIDGRIVFTGAKGKLETIIVSVKSGHVGSSMIRDLKGTVGREGAAMGLMFTLQEPTSAMRKEAVQAGFYRSPIDSREYPRIVIHTVRELLEGHRLPDLPTRHGLQAELPLPTTSRGVTVGPIRKAPTFDVPTVPRLRAAPPSAEPPQPTLADLIRGAYADRFDELETVRSVESADELARHETGR